ncbi:hypothetical protein Tco_0627288 [Tanacetum coccineum]|uniref:Uncharacterized protein n=1 Tax=Tanacetum coccineum TaxID=301880 RepID=A0ABQ4WMT1_9ASTR
MNVYKGRMPTKIELTLEQSQQGVSNDVLVESAPSLRLLKPKRTNRVSRAKRIIQLVNSLGTHLMRQTLVVTSISSQAVKQESLRIILVILAEHSGGSDTLSIHNDEMEKIFQCIIKQRVVKVTCEILRIKLVLTGLRIDGCEFNVNQNGFREMELTTS